jgi:type I restriction enzyme S subunit
VILRSDGKYVDQAYLRWALRGPIYWSQVKKYKNEGAVFSSLNVSDIPKFEIPVPPLIVQGRIADILGALDDKIECNRRINQTLEEMARALYKHWFVDSPSSELQPLTEYMDVDPPIRIPKGKEVPFVEMKVLPTGAMSVTDVTRRPFTSGSRFQNGDTLLARITPCLENGKTAFVDFLEDNEAGFGSTEFIVLRAKEGISPQFVYCCARDERFRAHAIKSMVGSSGRQRVRSDSFEYFMVKEFDEQTMGRFHEQTLDWFKLIRSNIKENQRLVGTRDYLLPKLLSGEIEVKAAEKEIGALV